ncbi:MAG: hypothetical protein V1821_03160 [bacterium]
MSFVFIWRLDFCLRELRVGAEKFVPDFPAINKLSNPGLIAAFSYRRFFLRPANQAFEAQFVAASDDYVLNFLAIDSPAYSTLIYTKESSSFRN